MSKDTSIMDEIIEYIETSVREGLDKAKFIKDFRNRIETYLKENTT